MNAFRVLLLLGQLAAGLFVAAGSVGALLLVIAAPVVAAVMS